MAYAIMVGIALEDLYTKEKPFLSLNAWMMEIHTG